MASAPGAIWLRYPSDNDPAIRSATPGSERSCNPPVLGKPARRPHPVGLPGDPFSTCPVKWLVPLGCLLVGFQRTLFHFQCALPQSSMVFGRGDPALIGAAQYMPGHQL